MLQRAFLRSFSLSRRNLASSFGVRWISLPLTSSFSSSSHSVTDVPHHDDSLTAKQDSSSPSWQWVPPRASKPREGQVEEVVPIIKGFVMLSFYLMLKRKIHESTNHCVLVVHGTEST